MLLIHKQVGLVFFRIEMCGTRGSGILLTETWLPLETYGTRPSPRAAHTMNKIDDYRVIVFGGRQPERRMNDIHILNLKTMVCSNTVSYQYVTVYL